MQHYPYPEIQQFRNTIKTVRERASHAGVPLPTITFKGSVKLHGTNASVVFPGDGTFYAQSRSRVISVEDDNHGFAKYVESNKENFQVLADFFGGPTVVYGEWFGQGIQGGVAVSNLPKTFIIFAVKFLDTDEWQSGWHILGFAALANHTSIFHFPTFEVSIDFNCPELTQNYLREITEAVEKECPVGKAFGISGVGEGVVWSPLPHETFNTNGLMFKVKGEKHSESKVKTLAPVDVEKLNSIRELVDHILTEHRLEKKLDSLIEQGYTLDIKHTGVYLKIVGSDIYKEESDTIEASGLSSNEVMSEVNKRAKKFWMEKLNG